MPTNDPRTILGALHLAHEGFYEAEDLGANERFIVRFYATGRVLMTPSVPIKGSKDEFHELARYYGRWRCRESANRHGYYCLTDDVTVDMMFLNRVRDVNRWTGTATPDGSAIDFGTVKLVFVSARQPEVANGWENLFLCGYSYAFWAVGARFMTVLVGVLFAYMFFVARPESLSTMDTKITWIAVGLTLVCWIVGNWITGFLSKCFSTFVIKSYRKTAANEIARYTDLGVIDGWVTRERHPL